MLCSQSYEAKKNNNKNNNKEIIVSGVDLEGFPTYNPKLKYVLLPLIHLH